VRKSILIPAFLAIGAATAGADCVDTLVMSSLVLYHQTVTDSKTLGTWDSTTLDPWDASSVIKAGPASFVPYDTIFSANARSVSHPRAIYYACGTDSVSTVHWARVTDSVNASGNPKRYLDSSTTTPTFSRSTTGLTYYPVDGTKVYLSKLWSSSTFSVGMLKADSSSGIQSWGGSALSLVVPTSDSTNLWNSAVRYFLISSSYNPIRTLTERYMDTALSYLSGVVDSIGKKGIDSTRAELLLYHYNYTRYSTTGILPRSSSAAAFSVRSLSAGVEIALPRSAQVQIVGIDGRVVRSFTGTSGSQLWDGRDNAGRKLSGIWLVRAEGLGAKTVLVR